MEKSGSEFRDLHTTSWRTNNKNIKIYKTLIKLRFTEINPLEKYTGYPIHEIKSTRNVKKNDSRKKNPRENFCSKGTIKTILSSYSSSCEQTCLFSTAKLNRRAEALDVLLGKRDLKICSKFTGKHPYRNAISIKLLCIISEYLYSKTPLEGCFWKNEISKHAWILNSCKWTLFLLLTYLFLLSICLWSLINTIFINFIFETK